MANEKTIAKKQVIVAMVDENISKIKDALYWKDDLIWSAKYLKYDFIFSSFFTFS